MIGRQTTPIKIGLSIQRFLKKAELTGIPVYLPFIDLGKNYSQGYCLNNCENENIETGCKIICGWIIWEQKETGFIEAEFHSVIERDSKLVDITPRVDGEIEILFTIDESRAPKRVDEKTWQTWSNIKSQRGKILEFTYPIQFIDAAYGT